MRMTHGLIVLGVLCASCGGGTTSESPGSPPKGTPTAMPCEPSSPGARACDPDPVVTVTYRPNPDARAGKACDLVGIEPDNVLICADKSTIKWTFVNYCDKEIKARIGHHRRQKYGTYTPDKEIDPLVSGVDVEKEQRLPRAVDGTPSTKSVKAEVKPTSTLHDGLFKYDVKGSIDVDPEIAIRRESLIYTQQGLDTSTVDETSAPSPSPSPSIR